MALMAMPSSGHEHDEHRAGDRNQGSEVRQRHSETNLNQVIVNDQDLTKHLQVATRKWYKKDYAACGKEVAAVVVSRGVAAAS